MNLSTKHAGLAVGVAILAVACFVLWLLYLYAASGGS